MPGRLSGRGTCSLPLEQGWMQARVRHYSGRRPICSTPLCNGRRTTGTCNAAGPHRHFRLRCAAGTGQAYDTGRTGAASKPRSSPAIVSEELKAVYEVVHRMGKGVLYVGSSRIAEDHPYYKASYNLSYCLAKYLGSTTWSGIGPGLMEAVTSAAVAANGQAAGFKILLEATQREDLASFRHAYLPEEAYYCCSFYSARKHGLVDAAVREVESDRTAVIALPAGVGTFDELFEVMALLQLRRMVCGLHVSTRETRTWRTNARLWVSCRAATIRFH
eukprot:scaffold3043_cov360-Prasinococcus_capsulatus_cf.AAC.2